MVLEYLASERTQRRTMSLIGVFRTHLSPPTFRQRNSAGGHQDNDDDSGKRLRRSQGVVPVVPKLKHALASFERAPTKDKIHSVERTCLRAQEYNATFRRARFDRAAT